ncbi:MAG TPA: Calx-beta domain-containing protein [Verrucomicrobiae bacterium]|nr:Calx-beta domain-containing protein [Verrucomicrobiae bacterium]
MSKLIPVARFCAVLGSVAVLWAGYAPKCEAQNPPPNDNLAQAQIIIGVSGSVSGTNLFATAQAGEPAPVPLNPAQSTIWYVWTAPISSVYDFNTRNSTYTGGAQLQTVLAVYKLKTGTNVAFTNLTQVASDEIDPSETNAQGDGVLASRVDFTATLGTKYLIQIDGALENGANAQGLITLNWGPSLVAGAFGFSTPNFVAGCLDDTIAYGNVSCRISDIIADGSTVNPSLHNACGTNNVRITVTRSAPAVGRSEVNFSLVSGLYTNIYETNYVWTNTFTTTTYTNGAVAFTNTFTTNIASVNLFENYVNGGLTYMPQDNDYVVMYTNIGGAIYAATNYPSIGGLGLNNGYIEPFEDAALLSNNPPVLPARELPDFFTNYPNEFQLSCPFPIPATPPTVNSDGSTTTVVQTDGCSFSPQTIVVVPAAIEGLQFTGLNTNLTFDDFQMSQDVYVQVNPLLAQDPEEAAFEFPGPEDPGFSTDPNYTYFGLNSVILCTLSNAVLDPLEDPDIVPPTIAETTAKLNVLNIEGSPIPFFTNNAEVETINLERATFRCNKDVGVATFSVQRFPPGIDEGTMVHYTFNSDDVADGVGVPAIGVNNNNRWPSVADSDYAVPQINSNQIAYDWSYPTDTTWTATYGTLQWAANDRTPKTISVPINHNGAVEFDSDIYVTIFLNAPDEILAAEDTTPVPIVVGNINTANLTINYDNTSQLVEPGGAVDRTWNVDGQNVSDPPQNPVPGANQQVNAVAIEPALGLPTDGMAIIGGDFTSFDSHPASYVVRLQTNGLVDKTFLASLGAAGLNGPVNAVVVDSLGNIIIGGNFTSVDGTNTDANHLARLTPSGSLDLSFSTGFGFNGGVATLALDAEGRILVGGSFSAFNTTNCNNLVRLLPNGALDTSFLPSSGNSSYGTDGEVTSLTVDSLGNVVVGGQFAHINGTNWNNIARLLPNGALDTTFNPGTGSDSIVYAVAVQNNNDIIMGGSFRNVNGFSANSIARLNVNGSFDTNFNIGTGANDAIYSLVVQPQDQCILLGGQFTTVNSLRRVGMARLLPQGWVDTSFMDTAYNQYAGLINNYYNTNAYNPNDYPNPYNYHNAVFAMGLQADTNIVIGGSFFRVGGGNTRDDIHTHVNVARIIGPGTGGVENGGIGNDPGNITMTQNPYTVDDTANQLYLTLQRTNGSLGPAVVTLGTNTLPPGPGAATQSDFGLGTSVALFNDIWQIWNEAGSAYGWRQSDGFYGFNNNIQPENDNGESKMTLVIHNDKAAMNNLLAGLSLLNLNSTNILTLGGVEIPSYPAYGQNSSPLEILDDNQQGGTFGFSATNYLTVNTAGTVTITVLRTNGSAGAVTMDYGFRNGGGGPGTNTAVGAANSSGDYNNLTPFNPLRFAAGEMSKTFTVPITDQATMQPVKDFTVYLYNLTSDPNSPAYFDTNAIPLVPSTTIVTIVDGNFQPGHLEFSSPTYSVLKGGTATVTVDRVGGALGQLTVDYGTANGTATSGLNYTGASGQLTFASESVTPQTFTVSTLQDNVVEGAKTVNLSLSNPQLKGSQQGSLTNQQVLSYPSNAVLTINDVDSYGTLNFLVPNYNILQNANQALVTVTRTGGTIGTVQVQYATTDGNNAKAPDQPAYAGTNYGAVSGTLTFSNSVTSQSFIVPIYYTPNETNAANRTLNLVLFSSNPSSILNPSPETATLTILDPQLVLNSAGAVDQTTLNGTGFNNYVSSLSLQPDGSLVAGGDFTIFDSYVYDYVARLLPDGAYDNSFLQSQAGANSNVWQVLSQAPNPGQTDGSIMAVGAFYQFDQVNRNGIARLNLDGSLDESFNPGAGADSTVFSIAEQFLPGAATNQSTVPYYVIGGNFANFDGLPAGGVARLMLNGEVDPNFNLGAGVSDSNVPVHVVMVQPNNQILVGGDFVSFNNAPHHHLVRLNVDGSLDTSFAPFDGVSSDINGSVRAIQVQPDSRIVIGGLFTSIDGKSYNYIARLNTDGSLDTNFNVGVGCNNSVLALALDSQTRILVGGEFSEASGVTRNGITRLNPDGTVDPTINFGFGANGYVDSIVLQTNDEIDVGGGFTTFNNIAENNFARLYGGANAGDGSIEFSQPIYGALESGTNAEITLQRIGGEGTTAQPTVSAVFYTSDGTGINGENYIGVTNTVVFPYGETFETVTVPIINGATVGPDAIVNLDLTNALYAGIGPTASAELIITNVNTALEFSANSYRQSADAPSGSAAIPIVLAGNSNNYTSVTVYTTNGGTAAPGTNYIAVTNTLFFSPGQLTNYFVIPLINSPLQFGDLTVNLGMNNPSNAIVGSPSSAVLTIGTINTGPGVLAFSATNYDYSEGATNAIITIIRTNGSSGNVSATLITSNGPGLYPGIAGVNYSNVYTNVTFADGETSKSIDIPVIQQTLAGQDVTVLLTLTNATGGATIAPPNQVILTIQNDLENFSFGSSSYFFNENAGTVSIPIYRNGPTNTQVSVFYTTYSPPGANDTNGYAVPNVDYVPTSGTLVFGPGQTFQTIPITVLQGTNVNFGVETFLVNLENPSSGAQIGSPGTAQIGIISDVTGFNFPTNSYYVAENGSNIVITVDRINANTGDVSVEFWATNLPGVNNAINGVDFVATNGTLFFQDGQATNSFTVQILNPNIVENPKNFSVYLSQPSTDASLVQPTNATVYITNVFSGVSFGAPQYTVSECGVEASISVILTGITNQTVQVSYSTQDGSGKANVNYVPTSGTLTFQPGQTQTNFNVQVINNHLIGPDHTVQLNLSGAVGAQLLNPSTAQLTIQECNGSYVVASGTAFVTGSIQPSSGAIFSNDTVTILFGLRDIAGGNTANLVATLLATNGVTNVSGPQDYGMLIQHGPTKSEPFTFTAVGSNGQNIVATLALQDGSVNLGTAAFGFTIGGSTLSYTNPEPLTFYGGSPPPTRATNSFAPGYGYPSLIDVSGIIGVVTKVTATLTNFGHTFPSDVNVLLEAPQGQDSILMSHCGSDDSVQHVTLTFSPSATVNVPINSAITNGTYLPTAAGAPMGQLPQVPTGESGVPAAPLSPYSANFGAFVGVVPNGNWALWIDDDDTLDSGYVSNGWILNISTGTPVQNDADLELTAIPSTTNATVNNTLQYYVTLTNYGPASASNIIISNVIPSGMAYVNNSLSGVTPTNGLLLLTYPSLPVGSGIAFTITLMPDALGYATNIFTALADQQDPNSNNVVVSTVLVGSQSADLGVTMTETPNPILVGVSVTYTVVVTNNGPSAATGTAASIALPSGFSVTSLSPSIGTANNSSGTITWSIGAMGTDPVSSTATLTIGASATAAGTGLASASVSSLVYDPTKVNNFVSVKTQVSQPSISVSSVSKIYTLTWSANNYWLVAAVNLGGPWYPVTSPGQDTYTITGTNNYHFFRLATQVP